MAAAAPAVGSSPGGSSAMPITTLSFAFCAEPGSASRSNPANTAEKPVTTRAIGPNMASLRSGSKGSPPPQQARVEAVAQSVAQQIKPEHRDRNGHARKYRQARRQEQERLRLEQHPPPGGFRRLGPETEIGERRLREDRGGKLDGRLHDDRRQHVGQHVHPSDLPIAPANGAGGQDEFARPNDFARGTRHPRKDRDIENANGDDGRTNAGTEPCRQEDRGQNSGKREGKVTKAHD